MSRRIEVELTSSRDDGSWTWRAAGAKQPKGDVPASLVYAGAAVGDIVRVEAEFHVDGIEVLEIFPPRAKKERSDLLELKSRPIRDDELVTEVRAPRGKGRGEGGRGSRGGDERRDARRSNRDRPGSERPRRATRDEGSDRPKAKRLRPRRVHRDEVLASIPDEHRPIAEQVLQGGIPAVRAAIEKQNLEAKAAGTPETNTQAILAIADPLVSKLRTAEWRDRADNALELLDDLDLRDLRSVVVASDAAARGEESREIAEQLKEGLARRIENDHGQWLNDLQQSVNQGRTVRALRLSSRPVKAGAPLPTELANRLAAAASAALSADALPDRWATVLDAVAFTPIRSAIVPIGYPPEPPEELLEAVRRVADRVPTIAAHFGIDPSEAAKAKKRRPRRDKPQGARSGGSGPSGQPPVAIIAEAPATEAPATETPTTETPTTETPAAEAPATETPTIETPTTETPAAEAPATETSSAETADEFIPEQSVVESPADELSEAPKADDTID